jgi:hypothetical protein
MMHVPVECRANLCNKTLIQSLSISTTALRTQALNVMMHLPVECQVLGSLLRNLRREKSLGWMLQVGNWLWLALM